MPFKFRLELTKLLVISISFIIIRKKVLLFALFVSLLFACARLIILHQQLLLQPLLLLTQIQITSMIIRKSKKESLLIAVIVGAVMIVSSLKSLSYLKSKSKSHFKKISLPNLTKSLAPLCQCPCLITSISPSLVISPKVFGKALGQVNLVNHSENSKSELSLAN